MAAMGSVSLLSAQARPARLFSLENRSRSTRPRSSAVMAVSKACRREQVQTVAQQALAMLAAAQFLAGPAMAFDIPNPFGGEKQAGSAVSGAVSGETQEKKGPTDASSQVKESIKISQSGKSNEADSLADKFSKDTPASGAPGTGAEKSLGTNNGNL